MALKITHHWIPANQLPHVIRVRLPSLNDEGHRVDLKIPRATILGSLTPLVM